MRLIEGIPVERARLRATLTYALRDDLSLGAEWNPLDDDFGPLVNWRAVDETPSRPALVLGTSSDRIGTPSGRAYYGTLSKDLQGWTGLPVAPYAGIAFGEFEDDWEFIAGLNVRWTERVTTTHLWDGQNLHHLLDRAFGDRTSIGLVLVQQDDEHHLGVRLGVGW